METGAVCMPNIGKKGRQQRMRFGIAMLALGGLIGLTLIAADVSSWARVILFAPFFVGLLGVFQAKEKT